MANLSDYFSRNRYQPKYVIGDRVFGYWNNIPFAGTVGNDTLISPVQGPRISVHLDLPIKYDGVVKTMLIVKHKDVRPMKEIV